MIMLYLLFNLVSMVFNRWTCQLTEFEIVILIIVKKMDDYNRPGTSGGTTGRSEDVDGRGTQAIVDGQVGTDFVEEFFSGNFGVVDLNAVISDESFEIVPLDRFVDAVSTVPVEWENHPATGKAEPHGPLPAANVPRGPYFYPDQRLSMTGPACPPWLHAKQSPAGTISASYPAAESSLLIVTCSPDGGLWPWTTCCTAFLANFVTGGLCFSMFAMDEQHVRYDHALCHLIVFNLTAAVAIPLAGVLVNIYGYRCIMALGGGLLILWLLMLTTGCTAFFKTVLGIVGGFGAGAINGTYSLLLSVLFTERRALVHGIVYVGGVAGLMVLPPAIRTISESSSWLCVAVVYSTLTLAVFGFGLLVAVPYPFELKVLDNDDEPFGTRRISRHKAQRAAYNHRLFSKHYPRVKYPTDPHGVADGGHAQDEKDAGFARRRRVQPNQRPAENTERRQLLDTAFAERRQTVVQGRRTL
ncbi:uncharacterized protein LOC126834226 [Adelges cooleyi]|uniref:uncharacterized protein LOC126834226 n=1 Tax=Adelges cooleyi TaxID=133065 RepID=UPI00217F9713|nr:uncharacterized protein LOC126834226 [Adelges cooleyi]